ncbi:MAG: flagellar basal body-associated FliL family protein [Nitrospinae bacterium]|nr:flagellar basal body-associated FliL family protein [Nitrospinota bacterium]
MADAEEGKKGGSKLLVIIIAVLVVLLLAAGGGMFYFMNQKPAEPAEGAVPVEDEAAKAAAEAAAMGVTVELDPFVVNLSSEGVDRYLKAVIVLQLSSAPAQEEIAKRGPQIKDSIITVLSSKSPEEVLSIQGKYDLKLELVKRINSMLSTGVVREMFFTEFVVQ